MSKQVFDLQGSAGIPTGLSTELLRTYKVIDLEKKKYGFFDTTRTHLNFEVVQGGVVMPVNTKYSVDKRFTDNLRKRDIEDPNEKKKREGKEPNRRTVANIIIGGSKEQMCKLAFGEQEVSLEKNADNSHIVRHEDIEKWAVDMYNFMAECFGEENIISFIVHLDESNPHVHCQIIPVNGEGVISNNYVFGGSKSEAREKFLDVHNQIALVNAKWGLKRGEDIKETGTKHRTTEQFWRDIKKQNNIGGADSKNHSLTIPRQNTIDSKMEQYNNKKYNLSEKLKILAECRDNIIKQITKLQRQLQDNEVEYNYYNSQLKKLEELKENNFIS